MSARAKAASASGATAVSAATTWAEVVWVDSSLAASVAIQFCRLLAARLIYEARMSWRIWPTTLCRFWVPWIMPLMAVVMAESMGARAAFHLFWTSWAAWASIFWISRAFFFSATWTSCRISAIFLGYWAQIFWRCS